VIRLARPWIGDEERTAVDEVLDSGMLVMGARVSELEERLAERCGRRYAVACGSGTAALELALAGLGIASGDVLCPDLSWPSPAHAIARAGARPVLVDVDAGSWNGSALTLAAARTASTRAAIVIDQFGTPADHPAIAAALPDLPLVVDAACSLGATIAGRPSASFGVVACLSFHPRKVVTTGEGGACVTDDEGLADELRMLRNHGQRGPGRFAAPAGNQRMTEMAAAMGIAQLARLDAILLRRRALAERYHDALEGVGLQKPPGGATSNWQTFGVVLPEGNGSDARDALVARLRERGVESGRLSYALHRIGSLEGRATGGPFPVADRIASSGLALPLHPLLTDEEQDIVLDSFFEAARALQIGLS
jgi:perosamine synthetase